MQKTNKYNIGDLVYTIDCIMIDDPEICKDCGQKIINKKYPYEWKLTQSGVIGEIHSGYDINNATLYIKYQLRTSPIWIKEDNIFPSKKEANNKCKQLNKGDK